MHQYWAFGLYIHSEIEFPELYLATSEDADVIILYGDVPQELIKAAKVVRKHLQLNDQEFLLSRDDAGRYYASNGNKIVVSPLQGAHPRSIRLYVLATVMAAILHQRKKIPYHASAILFNNEIVLFAGQSKAGKSTLLSGLMKRGYRVFSDDIVVLSEEENNIFATASYPMIKLWEETILHLNDDRFADKSFAVAPDMNKYGIFFHKDFDRGTYPIKKIILLALHEASDYTVTTLQGADAFLSYRKKCTAPIYCKGANMLEQHFLQLTRLGAQANIFRIARPQLGREPEALVNLVETIL